MLAIVSVGIKRAMKLLVQYPAIYFTPMFTPFMFGPVMSQPCLTASTSSTESTATVTITCFKNSSCSSGNKNKRMHLSFLHTYLNILLTGIGSYLALMYFDKNLVPRGPNLIFPIHEYVYISLPVCLLTIIIIHILETKKSCCWKICLPFTKREELSFLQEEYPKEDTEMQAQSKEGSRMEHFDDLKSSHIEGTTRDPNHGFAASTYL